MAGISSILKLPVYTAPTSEQPPRGVDAVFDHVRVPSPKRAEALQAFTNSFEFRFDGGVGLYEWYADASIEVSFGYSTSMGTC